MLAGGCQCGAIRYALAAMPERANLCFCRMCQKAVGGPFAAFATVNRADFALTRGTPRVFRSSSVACRQHCPDCGTPLTFAYDATALIDVTIGSLDSPDSVPPTLAYGVDSRWSWYDPAVLDHLTAREIRVTIDGREVPVVSCQHPDFETPADWTPKVS